MIFGGFDAGAPDEICYLCSTSMVPGLHSMLQLHTSRYERLPVEMTVLFQDISRNIDMCEHNDSKKKTNESLK